MIARAGSPASRYASAARRAIDSAVSCSSIDWACSAQASRIVARSRSIEVVGHVVDGPPVELERLAPRRQAGGLAGTGEGRLERLAAEAGPLVVDGRVDLRGALQPRPELARPRVVAAALRGGDRPIQRVAQELVAEVVQPADAGRVQDELVDQLLERRLDRVRRQVHDPGQDVRHEAAADDGARRARSPAPPATAGRCGR